MCVSVCMYSVCVYVYSVCVCVCVVQKAGIRAGEHCLKSVLKQLLLFLLMVSCPWLEDIVDGKRTPVYGCVRAFVCVC